MTKPRGCCDHDKEPAPAAHTSRCCDHDKEPAPAAHTSSCCDTEVRKFDWLLWGSLGLCALFYNAALTGVAGRLPAWAGVISGAVFELLNTMWLGLVIAVIFVGLIGRIPQNVVVGLLGRGGTLNGLARATGAGVLLDLCSHGILMVGMQLYQRGASLGQVMAFLIASPWNSLSLTIILIALIGLPWTLAFLLLSAAIGLVSGFVFDRLVARGVLPANPNAVNLPQGFRLRTAIGDMFKGLNTRPATLRAVLLEGIRGSRMVFRWLLFGVLLAAAIRAFVDLDNFHALFGPTTLGLLLTLAAATVIEVCSEGSTPIAADIFNRAGAPGNSFAFLMTGVSTDYTEVMVIRDNMKSWKVALFLPLVTVPQVFVVSLILNLAG
jgi:uncharacterized membrane protein YraQ (UPF0718 family)